MRSLQLRWPVIVAALAVTLAVLFGGTFLVRQRTVEQPLAAGLSAVPGVERYTVAVDGGQRRLEVVLKDVPDLAATYQDVDEQARRLLGPGRYAIHIHDSRTPELEATYHRMHFALQEALATGKFTAMAAATDQEARRAGLQRHKLTVTDRHLFVQLHAGDHFLYEVLPRPQPQKGGEQP